MLTVRLHGHLEEKFGSEFRFEAATVREVIDALQANFDDFTEEFIKDQRAYNIIVDAEAQEIDGCVVPIKTDSTIDIIPIIGGAGFLKSLGLIILGAVLIMATAGAGLGFLSVAAAGGSAFAGVAGLAVSVIGAVGASTIAAIGWGLALAGVASLLAGPDGPDGGGPKSSTLSRTDNIIGQGMPVPVGYGRLMIGSVVLSATASSSYTFYSPAWTYDNGSTGLTQDKQASIGSTGTDAALTYNSGATTNSLYDGGISGEQQTLINSAADTSIGPGSYEVVNTLVNGFIVPITKFVPSVITGTYDDSSINPR